VPVPDPKLSAIDRVADDTKSQPQSSLLPPGFHNDAFFSRLENRRQTLTAVLGQVPGNFWEANLLSSLGNDMLLQRIYDYAQWLIDTQGVAWPDLYLITISYFLAEKKYREALIWHIRLSSTFTCDATAFAEMLKRFITNPSKDLQDTLQSLYSTSPHRNLYDELIPYLYAHGRQRIARSWRPVLSRHGDGPVSEASRPFLRFYARYYLERSDMTQGELRVAALDLLDTDSSEQVTDVQDIQDDFDDIASQENGLTSGFTRKKYNDQLGARLLATSWMSLDFALSSIKVFDISNIGPLSLQSIALREPRSDLLIRRIRQLEVSGIGVGSTSYALAVRHLAANGEDVPLQHLIHGGFHPEVFDDARALDAICKEAVVRGDQEQIQLLCDVRLAAAKELVTAIANSLLISCLRGGLRRPTLKTMDYMMENGVQLLPTTSNAISAYMIHHPHADKESSNLYSEICLRSLDMGYPLSTEAFRVALFQLGMTGRLGALDYMAVRYISHFIKLEKTGQPTLNIHVSDVPGRLSEESVLSHYEKLPCDLAVAHNRHPVQYLIDARLQRWIVRWGFTEAHRRRQPISDMTNPAEFFIARGVKLLAILRDKGVNVEPVGLGKAIIYKLAELSHMRILKWRPSKQERRFLLHVSRGETDRLTLEEAKMLCDLAWGSEILPKLPKLRDSIHEWGRVWEKERPEIFKQRRRYYDFGTRLWAQFGPGHTYYESYQQMKLHQNSSRTLRKHINQPKPGSPRWQWHVRMGRVGSLKTQTALDRISWRSRGSLRRLDERGVLHLKPAQHYKAWQRDNEAWSRNKRKGLQSDPPTGEGGPSLG